MKMIIVGSSIFSKFFFLFFCFFWRYAEKYNVGTFERLWWSLERQEMIIMDWMIIRKGSGNNREVLESLR